MTPAPLAQTIYWRLMTCYSTGQIRYSKLTKALELWKRNNDRRPTHV